MKAKQQDSAATQQERRLTLAMPPNRQPSRISGKRASSRCSPNSSIQTVSGAMHSASPPSLAAAASTRSSRRTLSRRHSSPTFLKSQALINLRQTHLDQDQRLLLTKQLAQLSLTGRYNLQMRLNQSLTTIVASSLSQPPTCGLILSRQPLQKPGSPLRRRTWLTARPTRMTVTHHLLLPLPPTRWRWSAVRELN